MKTNHNLTSYRSEEAFRKLISEGERFEEAVKNTQDHEEKLLNSLAESKIGSYSQPLREATDEYLSVVMKVILFLHTLHNIQFNGNFEID